MNIGAAHNDPSAGLIVLKKVGDRIDKGEPLCTIHYNREDLLAQVLPSLETAFQIREESVKPPVLVERIIGTDHQITAMQ
jgi:thymidine phosphorylase